MFAREAQLDLAALGVDREDDAEVGHPFAEEADDDASRDLLIEEEAELTRFRGILRHEVVPQALVDRHLGSVPGDDRQLGEPRPCPGEHAFVIRDQDSLARLDLRERTFHDDCFPSVLDIALGHSQGQAAQHYITGNVFVKGIPCLAVGDLLH